MGPTETTINEAERLLAETAGTPIQFLTRPQIREMRALLSSLTRHAKFDMALNEELGSAVPFEAFAHAVQVVTDRNIAAIKVEADFGVAIVEPSDEDIEDAARVAAFEDVLGREMTAEEINAMESLARYNAQPRKSLAETTADMGDCGSYTIDFSDVIADRSYAEEMGFPSLVRTVNGKPVIGGGR